MGTSDKKVVLISGGTAGLGKALATILAPQHAVTVFGLESEKVAASFKRLGITTIGADIRQLPEIERVVNDVLTAHGHIDVLVNNAGVLYQGLIEDHSLDAIRDTFETNILGTILLTRAVVPHMKQAGRGRIINIVSRGGLHGLKHRSVYASSKWAMNGFGESLRLEVAEHGIGVTNVFPDRMNTGLFAKQKITTDLRKAVDPGEVAELIAYAISRPDDVSFPELGIRKLPWGED